MSGRLTPEVASKTTLLRLLLGLLKPTAGAVEVEGRPQHDYSRRDLSRRVGLVSQSEPVAFEPSEHDAFLRELMDRRLSPAEGKYLCPRGVRSALVHWEITEHQARG